MKLSIVIPTRGYKSMIQDMLACFASQTMKDFEVIFVMDNYLEGAKEQNKSYGNPQSLRDSSFTKGAQKGAEGNEIDSSDLHDLNSINETEKKYPFVGFITNLNSKFIPHKGASYVRNFGIKSAKGEFVNLMDDDEWFESDYLERSLSYRQEYRQILQKDFVLTPTLMYRKTGRIQNQGFSKFNYWFSRPIPQVLGHKKWDYIQMYSANSLLAPAYIFQQILFDEKLDFVYEDLDFSYRIYKSGYPIIVLRDLKIHHMEREKTKLEEARVGNPIQAYKKAKHRIIFVKKYAKRWQKLEFYLLGFRGQPLWLIGKILLLGKKENKLELISALIKGTIQGI